MFNKVQMIPHGATSREGLDNKMTHPGKASDSNGFGRWVLLPFAVLFFVCCNPFAPGLDSSEDLLTSILGDPKTPEGVFQNIKHAYTFRDTSIYGQLVNSDFTFLFRDYDRGIDLTWGREEEMRVTLSLFRNVQRLDLVWNNVVSQSTDSANTRMNIVRGFNLTVTLNPENVERADGYANLSLARQSASQPWRILRWRDESNF